MKKISITISIYTCMQKEIEEEETLEKMNEMKFIPLCNLKVARFALIRPAVLFRRFLWPFRSSKLLLVMKWKAYIHVYIYFFSPISLSAYGITTLFFCFYPKHNKSSSLTPEDTSGQLLFFSFFAL